MKNNQAIKNSIGNLAVVRVRGLVGIKSQVEVTMKLLRLYKKNFCVVIPNNKNYVGMVNRIKDYVTWGEIDNETHKLLIEKRGEEYRGRMQDSKGKIKYKKFVQISDKKMKKYFLLP